MNLDRRIAVLEHRRAASGPATRCPECGCAMSGCEPMRDRTFRTVFAPMGEQGDDPDRCPACGRQQVYRVEFDKAG